MRVQHTKQPTGRRSFDLLDDAGLPVPEVSGFLRYLEARDYSPHTISAYAYDLLHFSRCLSAPTVNRILAAISSLYEYLIVSEQFAVRENPLQKQDDPALARVSQRRRPFMGQASRQRPIRRIVRVKTVERLPRPMSDEQVQQLLSSLTCLRDKAMILLMLQGGLRPGDYIG